MAFATARSTNCGVPASSGSSDSSSPPWPYGCVAGQPARMRVATAAGAGRLTNPVTTANADPCGYVRAVAGPSASTWPLRSRMRPRPTGAREVTVSCSPASSPGNVSARVHATLRCFPAPTTGTVSVSARRPKRRVATETGTVTAAPWRCGRPVACTPRIVAVAAACV